MNRNTVCCGEERIAALEAENAELVQKMHELKEYNASIDRLNAGLLKNESELVTKCNQLEAEKMADLIGQEHRLGSKIEILEKENAELKEQRNEAIIKGNRATERSNRLTALVREAIPAWKACRALARGGTKFEDWLKRAEDLLGEKS